MATPTSQHLPTKEEIEEFRALMQEMSDRKYCELQLADARKTLSRRIARLLQRSLPITDTDGQFVPKSESVCQTLACTYSDKN